MRLALLGYDDAALGLVRWAVETGEHELTAAYGADFQADELRRLAPGVRLSDHWEELLLGSTADAVVIGRGGQSSRLESGMDPRDVRDDQLRKLAQAAVPLIVVCPACEAIVGFEIEMIRRDVGGVIFPYVPGLGHPALEELAAAIGGGDDSLIGRVEQVIFEREQANRGRQAVLEQLPRDIALLRRLIGDLESVTATGSSRELGRDPLGPKSVEPPSLANLSIAFTSANGPPARWSISPPTKGEQARLILVGQRGKAVLTMPAAGEWSVDLAGDHFTTATFPPDADLSPIFLELTRPRGPEPFSDDRAWLAACRDQEAAEAVDRSLARGRTIELFNEQHTEGASFKGVMAMGGCLILVAALALVLVVAVVEGLHLPIRNWPAWRLWPIYLLAPIAAFLLLQLLGLAVRREGSERKPTLPVS